jgi:hypothetical protein
MTTAHLQRVELSAASMEALCIAIHNLADRDHTPLNLYPTDVLQEWILFKIPQVLRD